jgi:oligoribonuclease (3'-5' exoribonuclease)
MRYCSIDIETTGLDPATCQVIEFAAVIEDTKDQKPLIELPSFSTLVRHQLYRGDPYALSINHEILFELNKWTNVDSDSLPSNVTDMHELMWRFSSFLASYDLESRIIVAGKNFAWFDNRFLELLPHYDRVKFHHRVLDPMMLYLRPEDYEPPNSDECLRRARIQQSVKHRALDDALMVIQLLRIGISKQNLMVN